MKKKFDNLGIGSKDNRGVNKVLIATSSKIQREVNDELKKREDGKKKGSR